MKIGILTACNVNNNGTDLQAAAMYKIFKSFDNNVEIINYKCEAFEKSKKIFVEFSLKGILRAPIQIYMNFSHRRFRKKYIAFSPESYSGNNADFSKYDIVVSGSDQIWNMNITGHDLVFFLPPNTGKHKRFSYAASIGVRDISEWDRRYNISSLLKGFEEVSVRETSGIETLKQIGITARSDLDPILCIKRRNLCSMCKSIKSKSGYILLYLVAPSPDAVQYAKTFAKKENVQIINVASMLRPIKGVKTRFFVGTSKWLSMVRDASMIITNSYHGVSTAIAFNTNFRVFPLETKDGNERAVALLKKLNLTNFYINSKADNFAEPDWRTVNSTISAMRKESYKYIEAISRPAGL